MVQFIRQQGLKFQMVFWMTLISVISFTVLFGFNFMYYRGRIIGIQLMGVQAVAEIISQSNMFDGLDEFIDTGEPNEQVVTLIEYKNDLVEKVMLNGISVFYQDGDELYQITNEFSYKTPLSDNVEIPESIVELCRNVFYTGQPEKGFASVGDVSYNYYVQPVKINSKYKYGVCVYINNILVELLLMRYFIINVLSFIFVLAVLIFLVVYATNKVLIKPIIDMEKMVDSFVYQVSGGYATFAFKSMHGNELMILRNSLKRIEKLVGAHNKMMAASDRYSDWLQGNIDKLNTDNSILEYNLKSAQYDMLCDKEMLVGNLIAWENKCHILDIAIKDREIEFLQVACIRLDDSIDKKEFIEGLISEIGIHKGIPMDNAFRMNETDFVFVMEKDGMLKRLVDYIGSANVKLGSAWYIANKTKSLEEMLEKCLMDIEGVL